MWKRIAMLGITGVFTIVFLASATVDIFAKVRGVREIVWCVSGICIIGLLLFACAMPRLLQR